jgi:hypothetical protein
VTAVLAFALALATGTAGAEVVAINGISLPSLARALQRQPVQLRGQPNPSLTSAQVNALRTLIKQRDPGRLWIAVVTPMSERDVGTLSNAVGNDIPHDGILLGVASYNFYVASTWGNDLETVLNDAVANPNLPMYELLRRSVIGFAKADAKAGHPTPYADQLASQKAAGTATGATATSPAATRATASPTTPTTTPAITTPPAAAAGHGSSGISAGVIALIAAGGLLILLGVFGGTGVLRRSAKDAHRRKEQDAEDRAQVRTDFGKLGEQISDLDIDSSMPNASAEGKSEYAKAIDCYQDADKRLKQSGDDYQWDKAVQAIKDGLQHVTNADRLFSSGGKARDTLSSQVIDRLTKLAALHDSGALSDDEFADQKHKLLS